MKRESTKHRRALLAIPIILLLYFYLWTQNNSIEVNEYKIKQENLPDQFNNFTIVQISDLHSKEFGDNQNKLVELIKLQNPDIIVVTGDLFDRRRYEDKQKSYELIEVITKHYPVYYISGNHECWTGDYNNIVTTLSKKGVIILDNSLKIIEKKGEEIALLGLVDPAFYYVENSKEYESYVSLIKTNETLAQLTSTAGDKIKILLSHRPELIELYQLHNINIVLSGHSHGGQIRLPIIGGVIAPSQGLNPEYDGGLYKVNDTTMIVSRGLGNSLFPFRVNNRPELVKIVLKK